MTVRYKFRSSVDFESIELGGHRSILLRDLRAEVLRRKGLAASRDFDLLVSDAVSGKAYEDDVCEIPDGSSVIIKRVPSYRSVPSDLNAKPRVVIENMLSPTFENVDVEKFDDFGIDLYPGLDALPQESDTYSGNMDSTAHKKDDVAERGSQVSILRGRKTRCFGGSDLSDDASSKGGNLRENYGESGNVYEKKLPMLKSKFEQPIKLDDGLGMASPRMVSTELPTELRCSLCNTIFKEAVMIPCCQHSFCNRCIRSALVERARCPKCTSTKCTVDNLLPNLSLRQAIEHFLETQVAVNGLDNAIPKYVPDGESGIQVKEVSCAVSICQNEPRLPHSPSATGKGSNQVTLESAYNDKKVVGVGSRLIRLNVHKSATLATANQIKGHENHFVVASKQVHESSSSRLPNNILQKQEVKKMGIGAHPSDGTGVLVPPNKFRKGERNCFMCGSPHHLIRDCPAASNSYSMQMGDAVLPGGMQSYGQPYWQGSSYAHVPPYGCMYGAPGMMQFDPTIQPVGPFGIPSYLPSFYAGMPMPYGFASMGGVPPSMMTAADRPLTRAEFMDLQDSERNHKNPKEHIVRELDYDSIREDCRYIGTERRSHEPKRELEKETIRCYSDSDSQRINKMHSFDKNFYTSSHQRPDFTSDEEFHSADRRKGSHLSVSARDVRTHYYDKSTSEGQDVSGNSNHHNRDKNKHHYQGRSKKQNEIKRHSGGDRSQRSHHRSRREMAHDEEKVVTDHKRHSHKRYHQSDSSFEPASFRDRRQCRKEKESCGSPHILESKDEQLEDDRWQMADGVGEEYTGEEYHQHRRKRKR